MRHARRYAAVCVHGIVRISGDPAAGYGRVVVAADADAAGPSTRGTVLVSRVRRRDRVRFVVAAMLDSVRCLMSVVLSPSSDRGTTAGGRRGMTDRRVRVHRISSRYPAIEVRTRMDSYGTAVSGASRISKDPADGGGVVDKDLADGVGVVHKDDDDDDDDSRRNDFDESDDDDDDDEPCSKTTDDCTAAGCSSASDTDFYYEDRSDCHRVHTTVVELRAEEVHRTEAVQEEFEDSLQTVDPARGFGDDRRRTVQVVTKHRHVLSETCRVKVENLRYRT